MARFYLQVLQDPPLQELQPEDDPAEGFSPLLMPKVDIIFLIFSEEHFGHTTMVLAKTSFSNSSQQSLQVYS